MLEKKGVGELRQLRDSLQERLEIEERNLRPFEMETALLQRLQEAFLVESRKHGEGALVANSVTPDQPPSADEWWTWRTLSPSTLVLDCAEPDEIWESVAHPYNLAKAYPADDWYHLIERIQNALEDASNRARPKIESVDMIRFRKELMDCVISDYGDNFVANKINPSNHNLSIPIHIVHTSSLNTATQQEIIGPEHEDIYNDPKKIEFIKVAYDIIIRNNEHSSVSSIIKEIDVIMVDRVAADPDLGRHLTWGSSAAKRVATDLGVYVERSQKGRPPKVEITRALEVFRDGVRGLAKHVREADMNNGNAAE